MKSFVDLGKTAKKLLTDDYTTESKLKFVTTSTSTSQSQFPSSTTYTVDTTQTPFGTLLGDLSLTSAVARGTVITARVGSDGRVRMDVGLGSLGIDGLALMLSGLANPSANGTGSGTGTGSIKMDYMTDYVALAGVLDIILMSPTSSASSSSSQSNEKNRSSLGSLATMSLVTGHNGFIVGAETQVNLQTSTVVEYDLVASYTDSIDADLAMKAGTAASVFPGTSEVTLSLLNQATMIKTSYSHAVSKDVAVAGEVVYGLLDNSRLLTMGVSVALDSLSTVKGKVNTEGLVGLAYIAKVRPGVTLSLCSALNVKELDKGQKMGVQLAYEP
mmetsp:Transcript_17168/g.29985  ORF Transcript_17168/g.29985 Transcript_17168/m.29985 type:complete len:330 (+) Transcript_17168:105-1094(+)